MHKKRKTKNKKEECTWDLVARNKNSTKTTQNTLGKKCMKLIRYNTTKWEKKTDNSTPFNSLFSKLYMCKEITWMDHLL